MLYILPQFPPSCLSSRTAPNQPGCCNTSPTPGASHEPASQRASVRPGHCAIKLKDGQGAPHGDTGDGTSLVKKAGRSVQCQTGWSGVNTLALSGVGSASSDGTNATRSKHKRLCPNRKSGHFLTGERPTWHL